TEPHVLLLLVAANYKARHLRWAGRLHNEIQSPAHDCSGRKIPAVHLPPANGSALDTPAAWARRSTQSTLVGAQAQPYVAALAEEYPILRRAARHHPAQSDHTHHMQRSTHKATALAQARLNASQTHLQNRRPRVASLIQLKPNRPALPQGRKLLLLNRVESNPHRRVRVAQ